MFLLIVDDVVNEDRYWIMVFRGLVEDIVDVDGEFTEITFFRRDFLKDEWSVILVVFVLLFEFLIVGDLILIDLKDVFEVVGGVIFWRRRRVDCNLRVCFCRWSICYIKKLMVIWFFI